MDGNIGVDNSTPQNQLVRPPPPVEKSRVVTNKLVTLRNDLNDLRILLSSSKFKELLEEISESNIEYEETEDDDLIHSANKNLNKINEYIHKLTLLLIRIYRKKFPGLEEQIKDPLLYAKVCQRIGNKTSIDEVEFQDLLPSKSILVLRMTFSDFLTRLKPKNEFGERKRIKKKDVSNEIQDLTNSRQLTEDEMKFIKEVISSILQYDVYKKKILTFVSSQMNFVAPNLSAMVGTTIAAQLVGSAGGLEPLSRLDSGSIQMLGRSTDRYQYLHGFSSSSIRNRFSGIIGNCDIVQMTPPEFQKRASRMVSNKCVMAVRCDKFKNSEGGGMGKKLRAQVISSMTKIQAPPPPVQEKPLPIPDSHKQKTKRGGRNARRMKALYGMTEVRSKFNRVAFGEKQVEDFETGQSFGLLGAQTGNNSLKLRPKTKIKIKKQLKGDRTTMSSTTSTPYYGGGVELGGNLGSMASGMASSLMFTPIQGISLTNPDFNKSRKRKRNKFFDDLEFKKPEKKRKTK